MQVAAGTQGQKHIKQQYRPLRPVLPSMYPEHSGDIHSVPSGRQGVKLRYYLPAIVAVPPHLEPRKVSTSPIGLAIALVLLPAKSRPTARGLVATSSTIKEPESPLFKKELAELAITT